MTYRIVIRRRASADIADAHAWYEEQQEGLGGEFLDAVQSALALIGDGPLRYPHHGE